MEQVITIGPMGQISGLQMKPGQGLDLREFGRATITRASEVLFCPVRQRWYVEFRQGAGRMAGVILGTPLLCTAQGKPDGADTLGETAYFDEYDEAVQAEITVMNYLREHDAL